MHPAEDSTALVDVVRQQFVHVDVIDDPTLVAAALDDAPDVLVVNACWFAMDDERYSADQRIANAVSLDDEAQRALANSLRNGLPLLAVHTAVICFDGWKPWVAAVGAEWDWSTSFHPPPAELRVEPVADHPLAPAPFTLIDEEYQGLRMASTAHLVARSSGGHPLVWTTDHGSGRVAVSLLGHASASLENDHHQALVHRLLSWLKGDLDA